MANPFFYASTLRHTFWDSILGEKEKNAKDKRMATVEECTLAAANLIKEKTKAAVTFELVEGTHFSPIMPRLERAFEVVFG